MDNLGDLRDPRRPWTALRLAADLRARRAGAVEIARACLDRLDAVRTEIGGVAALDPERTLRDARSADERLGRGEGGELEGVPFTVKDWIDVAGWPVAGAAGSDLGEVGRRAETDATAVARLRAAGGVMLAITTASADSAAHGPVRNPHDPLRAPGGSSSGAAALTAAGVSPLALGSDSGGSIRLPAAWCGLVGLKASFGRVPLTGHFPRCTEFEDGRTVIGPLAHSVDDVDAVLRLIAGADGRDAGAQPVPLGDPLAVDLAALSIGVIENAATEPALQTLLEAGAHHSAEPVPDLRDEALELTVRYWGREHLTGAEVVQLLVDWDTFRTRMLAITDKVDVILAPATDGPAPEWRESHTNDYLWMLPWSLTGAPVVALPVGTREGLPISLQVISRRWEDHVAIAAARRIEAALR